MEKFRPNLDREGALDTVLEVPISHKNTTTLWNVQNEIIDEDGGNRRDPELA